MGLQKNAGALMGMRVFFVQHATASHNSTSTSKYMCHSAIQNTGTIGIELPFIATYVQRVPVVPSDSTGTTQSNDTIQPALK